MTPTEREILEGHALTPVDSSAHPLSDMSGYFCVPTALAALLDMPIHMSENICRAGCRRRYGKVRGMQISDIEKAINIATGRRFIWSYFQEVTIARDFLRNRSKTIYEQKLLLNLGYYRSGHAMAIHRNYGVDTFTRGRIVEIEELPRIRRLLGAYLSIPAEVVATDAAREEYG